jgi:hypothetical protein
VLLIVATSGSADIHGSEVAAFTDPVSWVKDPEQTESVPEMVGVVLTATVVVALHPANVV